MRTRIPADGALFIALLIVAVGAVMIGGSLYWSLRPAVLPNPGLSAYRPPAAPPVLARESTELDEADRVSIAAAAAENELLGLGDAHALAAAVPAPHHAERERVASRPRQKQRRIQQARSRDEFLVRRSWAAHDNFGFWFR